MNDSARTELKDIKNTVEWELIRLASVVAEDNGDEVELRPGERRSLTAAMNKISDAVVILARVVPRYE